MTSEIRALINAANAMVPGIDAAAEYPTAAMAEWSAMVDRIEAEVGYGNLSDHCICVEW